MRDGAGGGAFAALQAHKGAVFLESFEIHIGYSNCSDYILYLKDSFVFFIGAYAIRPYMIDNRLSSNKAPSYDEIQIASSSIWTPRNDM